MKLLPPFLACVAALLPLAGADDHTAPAAPALVLPREIPWAGCDEHIHYQELPQEYTDRLRQACREGARMTFAGMSGMDSTTLTRGKELDTLLAAIAAQPCWYERYWDDDVHPGLEDTPGIRIHDAADKLLFAVDIWPAGPAFARQGEEYVSLWEFCRRHLPYPEAERVPCTSPHGMPLPDQPVYVDKDELFCYIRMPHAECEALRRALDICTTIELDINAEDSQKTQCLKLSRADEDNHMLSVILDILATRSQWLRQHLYMPADVEPAYTIDIRLRSAKGELLWESDVDDVHYQPSPDKPPVSLFSELLPYLPIKL